MPAALSHLESIANEAIEKAIILVLQRSRTSSDPDLCKLWDEVRGKHRYFNWGSVYATDAITTAIEDYNSQVESNEQLNRTQFTNTYLDTTPKKKRRLIFAKINDPTCPISAIPQTAFKNSMRYKALQNDNAGRGLPMCFESKYNKEVLKELIVLLEGLTTKKRRGESITLEDDIPEHLQSFFSGLKDKKQSIILAILDLRTAFDLQRSECGFTFGGDRYTAEQIAELFKGEVDGLIRAFDDFLQGKKVAGGVEMLRKFTGVSCMNDFLVVAATIYEGIQIVLDQVIDKELFPSLGGQVLPACVGVVSLQCSDCQCILVIICISSLLTIPHHCFLSETKGFHHH